MVAKKMKRKYYLSMMLNNDETFTAVLCDIKSSREYKDFERWKTQEKLFKAINLVNKLYKEELYFPFDFSSGDSIQALFTSPRIAFECCLLLRTFFYPYSLRFGIGIGNVNNYFISNASRASKLRLGTNFYDGIAYHKAMDALTTGKMEESEIVINTGKEAQDNVLNRLLKISSPFAMTDSSQQRKIIFFLSNLISPISSNPLFAEKYCRNLNEIFDVVSLGNESIIERLNPEIKQIIRDSVMRRRDYLAHSRTEQDYYGSMFTPRDDLYIAKILDVSEQNVSNIRRKAGLKDIRNNEIAVYNYLGFIEEKKYDY